MHQLQTDTPTLIPKGTYRIKLSDKGARYADTAIQTNAAFGLIETDLIRIPHSWWKPKMKPSSGYLSGTLKCTDVQLCRDDEEIKKLERSTKIRVWMMGKSSRNKTLSDKICRLLVTRATEVKPEDDFLRDPLIDNNQGFDPEELDRFERGELG